MNRALTRIATAVALLGAASASWSLGLGRMNSAAVLGQPLNLLLPVRLDAGESLPSECVSAAVHFGDNRQSSAAVQVAASGIRISTGSVVDEPVVTVDVTVGCATHISRKFVLFADPPSTSVAQAPPAPPPPISEGAVPTRVAAVTAERKPQSTTAATGPRQRPAVASPSHTQATPAARAAAATARSSKKGNDRVASAPRLRLDPIDDAVVLADPTLRLDDTLPPAAQGTNEQRATAAALWRALNATPEELTQDRERLKQLEQQFIAVRRDAAATQSALATLEARLHSSEESRYANPLVFGLTTLSTLLMLLLGASWWRGRREQQAAWWREEAQVAAETLEPPPATELARQSTTSQLPITTTPTPFAPPEAPAVVPAQSLPAAPQVELQQHEPVAEAPRREVSVEELIDLEQQAEFFLVLGQEEAAIDLLMSHVRNTAGTSPLPYLKLLEIYQRRGEQAEYDRIRERFNSRFNAYAPSWDEELMNGRMLEGYPTVMHRLENLWATPARALDVLQASLLRQDERAGTFDLPAYRELLFLYSIARDLADTGRATGDVVDLLLPVGDDDPSASFTLTNLGPLVAEMPESRETKAAHTELPLLDLDLDAAAPEPAADIALEPVRNSGVIEFERFDLGNLPLRRREG